MFSFVHWRANTPPQNRLVPTCPSADNRPIMLIVFTSLTLMLATHMWAGGSSTGKIPLTDLGTGTYSGFQGGLYSGGSNTPPAGHAANAQSVATSIVPRAASGQADPEGFIGFISIGMSNTAHEFSLFERAADADVRRNARVVIVNAAHGGQSANSIPSPTHFYWQFVQQRVAAAGLTDAQVQVAWVKLADANPANDFPVHSQTLRDELRTIMGILRSKFSNLAIVYLSSRIYGGYTTALSPEPQAYEEGFAIKWLIDEQIAGATALNWNPVSGPVVAPLLLWGPYLWADGVIARSDGLTWPIGDFENDHVHPSLAGEQKVAQSLTQFFSAEPSAQSWWWRRADLRLRVVNASSDASIAAASPASNFGMAQDLQLQGGTTSRSALLTFTRGPVRPAIAYAKINMRVPTSGQGGGTLRLVNPAAWGESTVTWDNAPTAGDVVGTMPQVSRDCTSNAACTSAVAADADGVFSVQASTTATLQSTYHSRESGQGPYLLLAERTKIGDIDGDGVVDAADLASMLAAWGACAAPCEADLDGNGLVDGLDIGQVIASWG